jgi:protein MpaA
MRLLSGSLSFLLALAIVGVVGPPAGSTATTVNKTWTFGSSVKGLPLRAYRIGDPSSPNVVVLIATMHGNEYGPARILRNLISGQPVSGANIWVIPDLNPDGYVRDTRRNARGVDLNRNFPYDWRPQTGTYYSGPAPASEPETRAVMHFLNTVQPDYVISLHQPLKGVDTSYSKTRALAQRLVTALELPAKTFSCGTGCHGTMTQWFNVKWPGAALTVEYGSPMSDRQVYLTGPRGLLSSVGATR